MCLHRLFLVPAPRCLGLKELLGEFVASGLFSDELLLEEVIGGGLAHVGMVGVPYFGGQDFVPSVGLLPFLSRLLGLRVHLK